MLLFHGVFARAAAGRLTLRESYQICMAGLAATRLFSAGGAGGIVLTAWALRAAGLPRRVVADKTIGFLVLTYLVYTVSLIVFGFGLRYGVFPGPDPFTMTVIPATLALDRHRARALDRARADRLRAAPAHAWPCATAASAGSRSARRRSPPRRRSACATRSPTCARATPRCSGRSSTGRARSPCCGRPSRRSASSPALAVLVVAFFVGMLGNLLPLPGGIGGVDGGMIGAFAAFNVDTGLAVVAVLVYRGFTFWLPTDARRDRLPPAAQDRRALENRARGATLYKLK